MASTPHTYRVEIELEHPTPGPDQTDHILAVLTGHQPGLAPSISAGQDTSTTRILMTIHADTIETATLAAARAAHAALPAQIVKITACTNTRFQHEQANPEIPNLTTVTDAAGILGITRQAVLKRIHTGKLPATRIAGTWHIPRAALTGSSEDTP